MQAMPSAAIPVPFRSIQHVYFDDLDALNILHNARFLLFIERARGELLNAMGLHWQDDVAHNPDKFHVVAEHRIRYLAPVRGEGDVAVDLWLTRLGTTSAVVTARVVAVDGSVVFAESDTRIVRLDGTTFRPAPWSEKFRAIVGPLLRPEAALGGDRAKSS
jgi:acyl-CoA thioester hydrolase